MDPRLKIQQFSSDVKKDGIQMNHLLPYVTIAEHGCPILKALNAKRIIMKEV